MSEAITQTCHPHATTASLQTLGSGTVILVVEHVFTIEELGNFLPLRGEADGCTLKRQRWGFPKQAAIGLPVTTNVLAKAFCRAAPVVVGT